LISKIFRQTIRHLNQELSDKNETIESLNITLEAEYKAAELFEKQKYKLNNEISQLKDTRDDLKEKMHYYKKN